MLELLFAIAACVTLLLNGLDKATQLDPKSSLLYNVSEAV